MDSAYIGPVLALLVLVALVGVLEEAGAKKEKPMTVQARNATMKAENFDEFDDTNEVHGTLTIQGKAARATYDGSTQNGYARGVFQVGWTPGDDVVYRAAFYLPEGTSAKVDDYLAIMRWDNYGTYATGADQGGITYKRGTGWRLSLRSTEHWEIPALPEGRWFTLAVRQHLASDNTGVSQVLIDGKKVLDVTAKPNMARSPIDRVRFGVVGITAGAQNAPLEVHFDQAQIRAWKR